MQSYKSLTNQPNISAKKKKKKKQGQQKGTNVKSKNKREFKKKIEEIT